MSVSPLVLPREAPPTMKEFGGSDSDLVNGVVSKQALESVSYGTCDDQTRQDLMAATALMQAGLAPRDQLEGLLVAQMVAVHNAAMGCFKRAALNEQTFEGRRQSLAFGNKLARTFTMQIEALQKYRGKGQQKVVVEHVHVHAGAQAIVGNVEAHAGGGVTSKPEGQPHARQLDHQPPLDTLLPPLPCADTAADLVPVTRDAERQVPPSRRKVAGSASR